MRGFRSPKKYHPPTCTPHAAWWEPRAWPRRVEKHLQNLSAVPQYSKNEIEFHLDPVYGYFGGCPIQRCDFHVPNSALRCGACFPSHAAFCRRALQDVGSCAAWVRNSRKSNVAYACNLAVLQPTVFQPVCLITCNPNQNLSARNVQGCFG